MLFDLKEDSSRKTALVAYWAGAALPQVVAGR
jgi:hypothetical protein